MNEREEINEELKEAIETVPKSTKAAQSPASADPQAELERHRRLMAEVRDFAIFTLDPDSRITSWNAGAEIIFGYSAAEALGSSADMIFTPEDRADGAPEQEMALAAAQGRSDDERWHIRKDGTRLWGSGVMTALRDSVGGPPWYAKIVRDLTQRRLQEQRERVVASQLQASVQPAAPPSLPGLALRTFYRPAHKELSVGGDFFDVFGLSDGRSVLVVGDVSGKGVEAASQVATVRNMLRFALYNSAFREGWTLVEPVAALNQTLAAHNLLAGFVTLFVGVYDEGTSTLTYINCGQEAALLRRASTGKMEALRYTSPLLGMNIDSDFAENQVVFLPSDVLTVFTDGLTDMGPSRTQMLGEDGVIKLLEGLSNDLTGKSAQGAAEWVTKQLIALVDAQEPESVPDDVCVLIAVVETRLVCGETR